MMLTPAIYFNFFALQKLRVSSQQNTIMLKLWRQGSIFVETLLNPAVRNKAIMEALEDIKDRQACC